LEAVLVKFVSWDEAVEVVARDFQLEPERAAALLSAAIKHGKAPIEWIGNDEGHTTSSQLGVRDILFYPDHPYRAGEARPYVRIEDIDLKSLKAWLGALTAGLTHPHPSAVLGTPATAALDNIVEVGPALRADPSPKSRRGGVEKADWETYQRIFSEKVAKEGYPDLQNEKGWQRQADVERWLDGLVKQDRVDISPSTLARHAKAFMKKD
jgi:hypothetical protein